MNREEIGEGLHAIPDGRKRRAVHLLATVTGAGASLLACPSNEPAAPHTTDGLWRPSGHCYPLTSGDFLCRQLVVPR